MRELVLELMGEYGNLAVFLLILVENLFPPIPSEVILTFGGVSRPDSVNMCQCIGFCLISV